MWSVAVVTETWFAIEMPQRFPISPDLASQTLAFALRKLIPDLSWSAAKKLILARRITINGTLCLNDARRLRSGEVIEIHDQSHDKPPREAEIGVRFIDPDLIVIDKPAGVVTLRRDEESEFTDRRKELQPTLDELIPKLLPGAHRNPRDKRRPPKPPPVYAVHRLDRDTSGLMIFALSARGRDALIDRFSRHLVQRKYIAVVHGIIDAPHAIETMFVRDRGDGLRGSLPAGQTHPDAQRALTRIRPIKAIAGRYTLVECQLETGRTHQIRIHLAELGHRVCGEKLYNRSGSDILSDESGAPRQALHSADLRFDHPMTGRAMGFESPLPRDLQAWMDRLCSRA